MTEHKEHPSKLHSSAVYKYGIAPIASRDRVYARPGENDPQRRIYLDVGTLPDTLEDPHPSDEHVKVIKSSKKKSGIPIYMVMSEGVPHDKHVKLAHQCKDDFEHVVHRWQKDGFSKGESRIRLLPNDTSVKGMEKALKCLDGILKAEGYEEVTRQVKIRHTQPGGELER